MKIYSFVFPGQGSQSVGMLAEIAQVFPEIRATYAEASQVLGYDLWELVQLGPAELFDQTEYTQPALLTGSYALWKIIQTKNKVTPKIIAGHSLGEYTALLCAQVFSFADAVRLVAARGKFMQEAVPIGEGALAAIIGLDNEDINHICKMSSQKGEVLAPANFNSPGQVVIAGHKPAVERALILAKGMNARMVKLLAVSSPSHCTLMQPAADRLQELLEKVSIAPPVIPVVNNVNVAIYQNANEIRQGLVQQLVHPVRWVETLQFILKKGVTHMIECGPGKILTQLNKRTITDLQLMNTMDLVGLQTVLNENDNAQRQKSGA